MVLSESTYTTWRCRDRALWVWPFGPPYCAELQCMDMESGLLGVPQSMYLEITIMCTPAWNASFSCDHDGGERWSKRYPTGGCYPCSSTSKAVQGLEEGWSVFERGVHLVCIRLPPRASRISCSDNHKVRCRLLWQSGLVVSGIIVWSVSVVPWELPGSLDFWENSFAGKELAQIESRITLTKMILCVGWSEYFWPEIKQSQRLQEITHILDCFVKSCWELNLRIQS